MAQDMIIRGKCSVNTWEKRASFVEWRVVSVSVELVGSAVHNWIVLLCLLVLLKMGH